MRYLLDIYEIYGVSQDCLVCIRICLGCLFVYVCDVYLFTTNPTHTADLTVYTTGQVGESKEDS